MIMTRRVDNEVLTHKCQNGNGWCVGRKLFLELQSCFVFRGISDAADDKGLASSAQNCLNRRVQQHIAAAAASALEQYRDDNKNELFDYKESCAAKLQCGSARAACNNSHLDPPTIL